MPTAPPGHPTDVIDQRAPTRRAALLALAGWGAASLAACGGGGGSSDTGGDGSSGTGSTGSGSGTTTTPGSSPWVWATAGTSTVATVPTLAEFIEVIASGSVTYRFHASVASSTTTDPVSGLASNTVLDATLAPFLMGRYLVTNANWRAFCNAMGSSFYPSTARSAGQYWSGGAYPAGKENHPVFFVSLPQAQAYCMWLGTQLPGYTFYVPTEGEWEYAALGTHTGYSYPWGSSADISLDGSGLHSRFNCNAVCAQYVLASSGLQRLTYYQDSTVTTLSDGRTALDQDTAALSAVLSLKSNGSVTGWQYDSDSNRTWADFANSDQFRELVDVYGGYSSPVGSYPSGQSWCGCEDMAGNAYEWTSTVNTASNGAESGQQVNCVKGGSWYSTASSGQSTGRGEGRAPSGAYHSVGFRVAARRR